MSSTEVKMTTIPDCDIHARRGESVLAAFDGATIFGPWAYMCTDCMVLYGQGLGTGRGQRLVKREEGEEEQSAEGSDYLDD